MSKTIARFCNFCKKYAAVEINQSSQDLNCPECQKKWGRVSNISNVFDSCPICQCRQFYTTKDFNQALGCFVMFIGIILVPKTFGLSLPIFAFIDWLLYRRVKAVICCYRCGSEFRGFAPSIPLKPFMHHIGLKYDKYR